MATQIIRPTTHEEWLVQRTKGIGSSEVATILGLNPYETPYELWLRKTGKTEPKSENFLMKAGHYLEDAVSKFWADETGKKVIKRSAIDWFYVDSESPWRQVSPDRTFWLSDKHSDGKGILECKTTQKKVEKLPDYWFCQVQYQLAVSGLNHASIAWLTQGREFGYKDIVLNDKFASYLLEEVDHFWKVNIYQGVEPTLISASDVIKKYDKEEEGKVAVASTSLFRDYVSLKDVKAQIAELQQKEVELSNNLKVAMTDAESLEYMGNRIASWKTTKESVVFNSKKFREENPEACLPYMSKEAGNRRFTLK